MARILCIEDEPEIRTNLVEELSDFGHTVACAKNGQEGLQMIVEFQPEIILCDCLMPGMTGPQVFASLREQYPEFASVPFVFLSAHAEPKHRESILPDGAAAYLTKPIDFDELEAFLAGLVETVATRAPAGDKDGEEK